MPSNTLTILTHKLIPEISLPDNISDKKEFIAILRPLIAELLEKDFARLLQIMYRIDVQEKDFALTLQPQLEKDIPAEIAMLVYDRLQLKIKFREKYK